MIKYQRVVGCGYKSTYNGPEGLTMSNTYHTFCFFVDKTLACNSLNKRAKHGYPNLVVYKLSLLELP